MGKEGRGSWPQGCYKPNEQSYEVESITLHMEMGVVRGL